MFKIHVHTMYDDNSKEYADYCLENTKQLAKTPANITFTETKVRTGTGGVGHGEALNKIFSTMPVENNVYNIICDSDTVLVCKNWDETILDHMKETKVSVVGTSYEELGGFSSGNSRVQTFKTKPNAIWCVVDEKASKILRNIDMSANIETMLITDESMSQTFGIPVGYHLLRDTGWQFAKLFTKDIKYTCLNIARDDKKHVLINNVDYNEEYHLNNIPFVCHQRGSRKNQFKQTEISKKFYENCEHYVQRCEY